MPHEVVLMVAVALLVFMRAIQQLNVVHGHLVLAAITPYFIACGEVASTLLIVDTGWPAIPWVGTGGAVGVVLAMLAHARLRTLLKRRGNNNGAF